MEFSKPDTIGGWIIYELAYWVPKIDVYLLCSILVLLLGVLLIYRYNQILKDNCRKKGLYLKICLAGILCFVFFASVIIRLPHLNRPLADKHEWLTASVARIHQIWEKEGAWKFKFLPIMSFDLPTDRYINNDGGIIDKNGRHYYTSYPPFAYIFPYLLFKLIGVSPGVLPLQIFNIICHFINAVIVFLIVSMLTQKYYSNRFNSAAFVAFLFYTFFPGTLWYLSNVYFVDTFVITIYLIGLLLFLRFLNKDKYNWRDYALLSIVTFLMINTEWMGVFWAFLLVVYCLMNFRSQQMRKLALATIGASVLAILVIIAHYSLIAGFDEYIKIATAKYLHRSGAFGFQYSQITFWRYLWRYYEFAYFPMVLFIFVSGYLTLKKLPSLKNIYQNKILFVTLFFSLGVVLIHHLVFFNFSIYHDFSVLKTSVLLAILAGLFFYKMVSINDKSFDLEFIRKAKMSFLYISIICLVISSVSVYRTLDLGYQVKYKEIGEIVAANAKPNEVLFLNAGNYYVVPQFIYYTGRNVALWTNFEDAEQLMKKIGSDHGKIFVLDRDREHVVNIVELNIGS